MTVFQITILHISKIFKQMKRRKGSTLRHALTELLEYNLVDGLGKAEMQRLKQLASQAKPRKRKTTDPEPKLDSQTYVQSTDSTTKKGPKKQKKNMADGEDATPSRSSTGTTSKPATKCNLTKRHGKIIESNKKAEPIEPEAATPPVNKGFQLPRALVRNPSMLSEIASRSSQNALSRSASYQSLDSMVGTPRRASNVFGSQYNSANTPLASTEQTTYQALNSQVSPSSQLEWEAGSWLLPQPQNTTLHAQSPNQESASSESNIHPPIEPTTSQQPPQRHQQVVIDLWSDDEDTAPVTISSSATHACAPISSSAPVAHAQVPSTTMVHAAAPISPPFGSRQAIAAARLKHFEKKAPETIDLTLDD